MQSVLVLELLVPFLGDHSPYVSLNLDDSPHFFPESSPYKVASGPSLERDDVTSQMPEPVRQYPGPDQGLEPHVTNSHPLVALPLGVATPVLLDLDRSGSHAKEASSVDPASNVLLENQDLPRKDSISLLLEEQIVRVFEEYFGVPELVIRSAQYHVTDFCRCPPAVSLREESFFSQSLV